MIGPILAMAIAALHAELAHRHGHRGDAVRSRSSARWAVVLFACATIPALIRFIADQVIAA